MANCKLGDLFVSLDSVAEHDALYNALWQKDDHENYVWSAKNLSRAIARADFSVGATTIKDHRNEMCGCSK